MKKNKIFNIKTEISKINFDFLHYFIELETYIVESSGFYMKSKLVRTRFI